MYVFCLTKYIHTTVNNQKEKKRKKRKFYILFLLTLCKGDIMDFYRMKREAFKLIDALQYKNIPEIEIIARVQDRFGFGQKIVLDRINLNNELAKRQLKLKKEAIFPKKDGFSEKNGVFEPKN